MKQYYVYIVASRSRNLYTGITNDLERSLRTQEKTHAGFTAKYNIDRLVYFETVEDVHAAIFREKQIKGWWRRCRKLELIESVNPVWSDLSIAWFEDPRPSSLDPRKAHHQ